MSRRRDGMPPSWSAQVRELNAAKFTGAPPGRQRGAGRRPRDERLAPLRCGHEGCGPAGCTEPGEWHLSHPARPWTVNSERRGRFDPAAAAELWRNIREWRLAFRDLARGAGIPRLAAASFEAQTSLAKGALFDPLADAGAVKSAVDGVAVLAGVLEDDDAAHVAGTLIRPPVRDRSRPTQLTLVVRCCAPPRP